MKVTTKVFGEITTDDDKIITFPQGIVDSRNAVCADCDSEKENETIHWLQSLQETAFAMPAMDPLWCPDYNPK